MQQALSIPGLTEVIGAPRAELRRVKVYVDAYYDLGCVRISGYERRRCQPEWFPQYQWQPEPFAVPDASEPPRQL